MRRLFWLFLGIAIGGGAIFTAFNYHIVKTSKGLELVPKETLGLGEVYVDIRTFTVADWTEHRQLAADIVAAEKHHLLGDAAQESLGEEIKGWIEKLRR